MSGRTKSVIQTFKAQGVVPTVREIQERLRSPTTFVYSCAELVAAVGSRIDEFRVGDRVACIGEGVATHAEYNAVARTLVAQASNVSLEAASSSAVAAIALRGLRQACPELGTSVAVMGLGLLGQLLFNCAAPMSAASSPPSMTSSTTAARLGTSSLIEPGPSCPSACVIGPIQS